MIVTDEWLKRWMTQRGGYTKEQLRLIGVEWPPTKGWKDLVIGACISESAAAEFAKLAREARSKSAPVEDMFGRTSAVSSEPEPIKVWTDGACDPNPGVGGWGWHRADGASDFGGERLTTNNRMEMTAILNAMRALPDGAVAIIHSDSQYCVNGLTVWSAGWARKDWRKKGEPMPNRDLWLALEAEKKRLRAVFRWVRGHNGDAGNEKADRLAVMGREQLAVAA